MAEVTDWNSLAKPDAEWEQHVKDNFGGQQPDLGLFPDIPSLRSWITASKQAMTNEMGPEIKGIKEHDEEVEMRDGEKITCRIYQPENSSSPGPLFVIFHGGGWCIGGLENEELLCRKITSQYGATSVNVDYRLGPEHKFPLGHYDCHDATKWVAANAASINADPKKGFIIGGTSAGGNMTATVAHLFKDEKIEPALTGCLLVIPATCAGDAMPEKYRKDYNSYEQNKGAPILSKGAMDLFMNNYIKESEMSNPLFSPLLWESSHSGHPPSVFQICGQDPLRDEGLIYERVLREEEGVKTKVYVYPGQPHGFHSVAPTMKASQKFIQDSVDSIGWLLEQK